MTTNTTNILAVGSGASVSHAIVVTRDTNCGSAEIAVALTGYSSTSAIGVDMMDNLGAFRQIATIGPGNPRLTIKGPGTFRFRRMAGACGLRFL